jgi:hypothetical protein
MVDAWHLGGSIRSHGRCVTHSVSHSHAIGCSGSPAYQVTVMVEAASRSGCTITITWYAGPTLQLTKCVARSLVVALTTWHSNLYFM